MNSDIGMTGTGGTAATGGPGKVRIYELAKELGLGNKDMVDRIRALGIEAKNHMSSLEQDDAVRVKRSLDKERQENLIQERLTDTVIRRRTKDGTAVRAVPPPPPVAAPPPAAPTAAERREAPVTRAAVDTRGADGPPVAVRRRAAEGAPTAPVVEERPVETPRASTPSVEARPQTMLVEEPATRTIKVETRQPRAETPARPVVERAHKGETPTVETVRPVAPVAPTAHAGEGRTAKVERRVEVEVAAKSAEAGEKVARVDEAPAPVEAPAPATHVTAPRAEAPVEAARTAEAPRPAAKEEVRLGPTGRVIELPSMRQPQVFQVQVQEKGPPGRGTRDLSQKRDLSGRDRFASSKQAQRNKKQVVQGGKKSKQTQITTPAQHKRVIEMDETISVSEAARQMSVKATDVLKKLWSMGMTGITMNSSIDQDAAGIVASEFGFEVKSKAFVEADVFAQAEDAEEDFEARAPVVTVMGHVDHGKTSLLDAIRNANVAAGEAGGITQHIGAYKVMQGDREVVFLDTPGHEAFTAMRARGAQATDLVILVVAADDGVMPQTVEALQHARSAEVPIIVAVNKIDKPGAQPDRIRQQLSAHGLTPEAWGGDTAFVDVSARNRTGIDQLLEMILLQADMLELRANPNKLARGIVIEAKLDRNRGPLATLLVQDGTLKGGDTVVAGEFIGKVRAMLDDKGRQVAQAGPATPVELLGLSGVPLAGETFNAVSDEKAAKDLVEHRRDARRKKELGGQVKVSLENILENIKQGAVKELRIVLKADVQGSSEALRDALVNLATDAVKVDVISSGVGGITETDVNLAKAGGAIIVGFHVRPAGKASQLAEQEHVDIKLYDIIYEALDDVKKAMAGLLAPVKREKALGKAEVRQVFSIPKIGVIGGCNVTEGLIKRSANLRLVRDHVTVWSGKISSLRRFKDDVREVAQGYECGIGLENYNDLKEGDVIEAFEIEEIAPTL